MRLITIEDFTDTYLKGLQRGRKFIFSKFTLSEQSKTKSSFNETNNNGSNWWDIPLVQKRWNYKITGNENTTFEQYITAKYAGHKYKMISIGAGLCEHELDIARLNPEWEITCIDFSDKVIEHAANVAKEEGLQNINFIVDDIYKYNLPKHHYDIVFFHSSLHHFKQLETFMQRVYDTLKPTGKLIIDEFVGANRLQYGKNQLKAINNCISLIDKPYRKMYKSNLYKNKYYGSGLIRMIMSDPSECVESEKILPIINSMFNTVEQKPYGGNLLMAVLKHIAHHFVEIDEHKKRNLQSIFDYEDRYLENNNSDFVFGIYEKK